MRPAEIEDLEPEDVCLYVSGFLRYRRQDQRTLLEAGRLAGFMSVMPYLPKHIKRPSQVMKFDWDGEDQAQKFTHSDKFHTWVQEQDRKDVEKALAGEHTYMKKGSKGFIAAVKRLQNAGITIDGYDYSELTD